LLRFAALGIRSVGVKPVETGCLPQAGPGSALEAADGALLAGASPALPVDLVTPFRFAPPVAPALAAEGLSPPLTLERLADVARRAAALPGLDLVLVEPAGGALSPLAADGLGLDLARSLEATVVLVAKDALGVQGHALAALEAMRRRALSIGGVVLLRQPPAPAAELDAQQNGRMIRERGGASVLGPLPAVVGETERARAEALVPHLQAFGVAEAILLALGRP
jgi:dethiobiotin synthetase